LLFPLCLNINLNNFGVSLPKISITLIAIFILPFCASLKAEIIAKDEIEFKNFHNFTQAD